MPYMTLVLNYASKQPKRAVRVSTYQCPRKTQFVIHSGSKGRITNTKANNGRLGNGAKVVALKQEISQVIGNIVVIALFHTG
jgi:hypothetical protein